MPVYPPHQIIGFAPAPAPAPAPPVFNRQFAPTSYSIKLSHQILKVKQNMLLKIVLLSTLTVPGNTKLALVMLLGSGHIFYFFIAPPQIGVKGAANGLQNLSDMLYNIHFVFLSYQVFRVLYMININSSHPSKITNLNH